jgi:hypothetical protein
MDKSQQPSSFQQLEKVSLKSLSELMLFYEFYLTLCLDSSSEKAHMLPYVDARPIAAPGKPHSRR